MDRLEEMTWFPTKMYGIKKPEFLEQIRSVSDRNLEKVRAMDHGMAVMTGNYSDDPEVKFFTEYICQTAWNVLNTQGYAMDTLVTFCGEMWTQEHPKYSYMETHIHSLGAQVSAFYFLDVPKEGNKLVIHDPRPAKMATALLPRSQNTLTDANGQIVLTPEPGLLLFLPAWLPHSFTRNESDEPCRFVHMNVGVMANPNPVQPNVEVI